ncbi:MAG: alpha/beta hydrolase [Candidatus Kapabacteria bacterium]|nr:alpha/beta hydrolase [Candidatus Kapabacteria bacterium]
MNIQSFQYQHFTSRFAVLGAENAKRGTLVLLHGLYENLHVWDGFAEKLAVSYRVVVMDLPGHNPEAPLPAGTTCTIRDVADCVMALLRVQCRTDDAVIAGHSMGGAVAMQCLKHYPKQIAGLCLFHATPFADAPEAKANREKVMASIQSGGKSEAVEGLLGRMFAKEIYTAKPAIVEHLQSILVQVPESGMIAGHTAMRDREDTSAVLQEIPVPTLFILGKSDAIIPVEAMLPVCTMPQKSLVCLLSGVGHAGMLEAPKECEIALKALMEICCC